MHKKNGYLFVDIFLKFKKNLNLLGEKVSEEGLIDFDWKSIGLIIICVFFFVFFVTFKIHGSSIPYWNNLISDGTPEASDGLIVGTPRAIRSDEWLVQTPFTLSQANQNDKLSAENKSLGEGKVPLLMGLPAKHLTALYRPQNWGFFFLDSERAFSYAWNYKIVWLFLSFFLLLMLVTRSNFWISFFGSVWLFFSGFIQWWFSIGLPEMIIAFSFIFISSSYLLVSKKKITIIISSILLSVFSVNFVLFLYPPFQVPMAYLLIFLIAGFLLENFSVKSFRINLKTRLLGLFSTFLVFLGSLFSFYIDTKSTLSLIMNTAYPGKRSIVAEKIKIAQYFSGFYSILMKENRYPLYLGNVCEASSFFLLFPLSFLAAISNLFRKKRIDRILIMMLVFITLITIWFLVGFPDIINKYTLISFVPYKRRALVAVGIASIISLAVAASRFKEITKSKRIIAVLLAVVFLSVFAHGKSLQEITPLFLKQEYIIGMSIFVTVISYFYIRGKSILFFLLIASYTFASTFFVNPISYGLSPIYNKEITEFLREENTKSPDSLWISYGYRDLANFTKSSGINIFNGTQYTPKLEKYKILDPEERHKDIYNRYAHVMFEDNGQEDATFQLLQADLVAVGISPCSEKTLKMGVDYFLFSQKPDLEKLKCLQPLVNDPLSGTVWAYKRK